MSFEHGPARVYFRTDETPESTGPDALGEIVIVSLGSHQRNVAALVEAWRQDDRDRNDRWHWSKVVLAAAHHDDGKPERLTIEWNDAGKSFGYTYRGHRFSHVPALAENEIYARRLIREHHTYATEDVVAAAADLAYEFRSGGERAAAEVRRLFAGDLYALEVCDNLVADVETRLFAPEEAKLREFVECEIIGDWSPFLVMPWPFDGDRVALEVEHATILIDPALRATLHTDLGKRPGAGAGPRSLGAFTGEIVARCETAEWDRKEVTLCRQT